MFKSRVPINCDVSCCQTLPCVVFPNATVCCVPKRYRVLCSQTLPCVVFPNATVCCVPKRYCVTCFEGRLFVVFPNAKLYVAFYKRYCLYRLRIAMLVCVKLANTFSESFKHTDTLFQTASNNVGSIWSLNYGQRLFPTVSKKTLSMRVIEEQGLFRWSTCLK